MRVVITGGAGFLGSRLAQALLARGTLTDASGQAHTVDRVVLADVAAPASNADPRVQAMQGSLDDPAFVERVVSPETDTVFHLAAVVSGQAEAEFDVGMRVNLDATRALLERCRKCTKPPKFVFASSLAVFGGALPDPVPDDAPVTPQSSYGAQKAIGELLVNDMSRRRFMTDDEVGDHRARRLQPQARRGRDRADCLDARQRLADDAARKRRRRPIRLAGPHDDRRQPQRAAVDEALAAHVVDEQLADRVQWQYDPVIDRMVATWPARFEARIGRALGMRADAGFQDVVRAYIEQDMPPL